MEDPSVLYSIQNDIFIAIKKIHRNLKTEKACNKTPDYFEKHERDLDSLWKGFSTNHEKLTTIGKKKRDLYFRSSMFVVAEGLYKTTREKLHQMHHYYKLTKFPAEEQGSSQKNEIQEINKKEELEEISMEQENSDTDTEMNPVKLLENSDVATITDCAVMNIDETNNGVEFLSVELLLNQLSAQTPLKMEPADNQQKSTNKGIIDFSVLEQYDDAPNRKICCPVKDCLTQLNSKERMMRHLRVHNGEMPFKCNYCDYATSNSTRIQEHINTHSGIKPYKCSYCKYSSVSKKYIKQHEAKHCRCECGFVSKNRSTLETHQDEDCVIKQENKTTKYTCKHCKRGFATRVSSRAHKQERGPCSICDVIVCDLNGHMKKYHRVRKPSDVKLKTYKFDCETCGWKGERESSVLLHLIHHPQRVTDDIDVAILKKYNIL